MESAYKRLLVTAQITFSRKPFRVHGRLEYDKVNYTLLKRDVCFNVDIALTLLKGRLPGMSE